MARIDDLKNKLLKKTKEILIEFGITQFLKNDYYQFFEYSPNLVADVARELEKMSEEEIIKFFKGIQSMNWHGESSPYECLADGIFCQFDGSLSDTDIDLFNRLNKKMGINY